MGSTVEIRRPDRGTAPAYLAEAPHPANAPGLVVFEEWWGLDDRIKATADRLASHGFNVDRSRPLSRTQRRRRR